MPHFLVWLHARALSGALRRRSNTSSEAPKRYAQSALAPATRRAYESDWLVFASWCAQQSATAIPAAPATIAAPTRPTGAFDRSRSLAARRRSRPAHRCPERAGPVRLGRGRRGHAGHPPRARHPADAQGEAARTRPPFTGTDHRTSLTGRQGSRHAWTSSPGSGAGRCAGRGSAYGTRHRTREVCKTRATLYVATGGRTSPGADAEASSNCGGLSQDAGLPRSTVPPENSAPIKETSPLENTAPRKETSPPENFARSKETAPPENGVYGELVRKAR
jgi:hypothetical protein